MRGWLAERCSICGGEVRFWDGWDRGGDVTHDVCLEDADDYLPPDAQDAANTRAMVVPTRAQVEPRRA